MKTYVITLSQVFPTGHKRSGEPTYFRDRFFYGQGCKGCQGKDADCVFCGADDFKKMHTIRANYPLWLKRITEVQQGKAVLSVRQWTGKPYRSQQKELARLTMEDGIGIQRLTFSREMCNFEVDSKGYAIHAGTLAQNDGLSYNDWGEWFKATDLSQPLAIIHFTKFRY